MKRFFTTRAALAAPPLRSAAIIGTVERDLTDVVHDAVEAPYHGYFLTCFVVNPIQSFG